MNQKQLISQNIHAGYGDHGVLRGIDLTLPVGQITGIVGANACGKSTFLRTLSRLLKPAQGQVLLDGTDIHRIAPRTLARQLGLLPQTPIAPDGISVMDLVGRGRHPHQDMFARWSAADENAVLRALEATRTLELADRDVDELSGGQRQRVWIAMALAQETDVLLLDEPTTFLDISHQIEVLDLLQDLNRSRGTTIVMVLHDLNLAARYCDWLAAMAAGELYRIGRSEEILTPEMVQKVFGLHSQVMVDPVSGKPMMLPIGRHHNEGMLHIEVTP